MNARSGIDCVWRDKSIIFRSMQRRTTLDKHPATSNNFKWARFMQTLVDTKHKSTQHQVDHYSCGALHLTDLLVAKSPRVNAMPFLLFAFFFNRLDQWHSQNEKNRKISKEVNQNETQWKISRMLPQAGPGLPIRIHKPKTRHPLRANYETARALDQTEKLMFQPVGYLSEDVNTRHATHTVGCLGWKIRFRGLTTILRCSHEVKQRACRESFTRIMPRQEWEIT